MPTIIHAFGVFQVEDFFLQVQGLGSEKAGDFVIQKGLGDVNDVHSKSCFGVTTFNETNRSKGHFFFKAGLHQI